MTPAITAGVSQARPAREPAGAWRRVVAPSFSDFLFLSLILWLFLFTPDGWSRLLLDCDTGWHIRTGDHILATGSVPRSDLFSFSRPGEPWFAWEWGADAIYSWLHARWGLKGIVVLGGIQIGLFAVILCRFMLWRGANMLIALAVLLLGVGASSLHYFARPHLFTMVLVPVSLWLIEADRRAPSRRVWWLVPLTAAWTNLHGGFAALIACLGLLVAGGLVESLWSGGKDWARLRRYTILTGACAAATLLNPYGYHLHVHIAGYLRSDWIRKVVQEFQSPSFRSENMLQYEIILLGSLVAVAGPLSRKRVVEPLWVLFWAHQSLASARHATVFAAIAAPILASELTLVWDRWVAPAGRNSTRGILDSLSRDTSRNFAWTSLWPAAVMAGLVAYLPQSRWPKDFPEFTMPVAMVEKHKDLLVTGKVLTSDQWADYLIYKFHPRIKVFFDGRSDFYGEALGTEYLQMSDGRYGWKQLMDRHGFSLALVPVEWPLSSLLKQDAAWRLVEDGGKSLLFQKLTPARRAAAASPSASQAKKSHPGLMESLSPSEFPMGDLIEMKHRKSRAQSTIPRDKEAVAAPETQLWRLPSGKPLAEFALGSGFAAPGLMKRTPVTQVPSSASARLAAGPPWQGAASKGFFREFVRGLGGREPLVVEEAPRSGEIAEDVLK